MTGWKKHKNKGFSLMEIISALAILILIGVLSLTTIASMQQTRVQQCAQIIKSKIESGRDMAKARGTTVILSITKTGDEFELVMSGDNLLTEETMLDGGDVAIFYQVTGSTEEKQLGVDDFQGINGALQIIFDGGTGDMIGPYSLDHLIIANSNRKSKLVLQHDGGFVYYDYEIDDLPLNETNTKVESVSVFEPYFINETTLSFTGTTLQPEFVYDPEYVRVSGVYRARDVSDEGYVIVFTLKNPHITKWADDTTGPKELKWYIVDQS